MDRLVQVSLERWNDGNAFEEEMRECLWQKDSKLLTQL